VLHNKLSVMVNLLLNFF